MAKRRKRSGVTGGKVITAIILLVVLVVGNLALYQNADLVTMYLCGSGYNEDSEEAIAARESGNALAEQITAEGAVLMKNDNNALPLQTKKVNVFGWSGSDDGFMPQGTGSGTGSRNDLVTFLGGLKEAGIEYNETLAKAYDDLNWTRVSGGSYVIEAHGDKYKDFYGVSEAPESFYTDELMEMLLHIPTPQSSFSAVLWVRVTITLRFSISLIRQAAARMLPESSSLFPNVRNI